MPTLEPGSAPSRASRIPAWKRFWDVSFIVIGAPVWLPLMIGIGAAIPLVSRGPILFRQRRIGHRGRVFTMLKFRSMIPHADSEVHARHVADLMRSGRPMRKIDSHGDRRVRGLGRLLRSTGLDELPQLLNVLRGEMSLVGPRPCTPYEYEGYDEPSRRRLDVLPGLTGSWQVGGKNDTTFAEMIALDLTYIEEMSPWRDLLIMGKTPRVLFRQARGALRERRRGKWRGGGHEPLSPERLARH